MNRKAWIATAAAAALSASLMTGCAQDKNQTEASPSTQASPSGSAEGKSSKASDKPITLSIHMHYGNGGGGDQVFSDDWPIFKKAAELTNVSLKGTASKTLTNSAEAYNLMLASGNLSDIIHFGKKEDAFKLGGEGGLVALNELVDKYAPNIKKFWEQRPDVRKYLTSADGKIYYVSFVPDGAASTGWFIRQDWLDKLGLKTPTTADEYYTVLKAFRDNDPNGNGKKDEIPYFNRQSFGVYSLLNLWDAGTSYKIDQKTDTVVYDPLNPAYKTGMVNLAKWYAEGLIDKEIFTRKGDVRLVMLSDNLGGSTHDWFASTYGYNAKAKDKVPGMNLAPIAPVASVTGDNFWYDFRATVSPSGWGIASSNKSQVETIKYMDFWFSDEGRRLANYGIEGETYDMANGKPTFKKSLLDTGNVLLNLKKMGAQQEIGFHQDFGYEKQTMPEGVLASVNEYNEKYINKKAKVPELSYTTQEQERLKELEGQIETYRVETGQKWLLGAEQVEVGYDNFIKKLKALGIEEVLKIKNEAYARYKKG
ncbi:sugar ABC transporter permease [Paenibacillus sp. YN15]|uniref:sugar ABC transporter permease n=1 Tax=Paenibacillus sp. YN15 TaxID=1742774 RepID=UPI000DCECD9D|nr:sugar ABC transporter permease [Paenibacillus sp. YN15]RAU92720.1 sugar ABC transporter permease [Paenibacillus sp. YN15]